MATQTTNLGLTKPASSERVSLSVINGNYDIIDEAVASMAGKPVSSTAGNFPKFDSNGNLADSGYSTEDFDGKANATDTVLNTTLSRGRKANTTVGMGSFAFGEYPIASGNYSHAEGRGEASAFCSHAEGYGVASGRNAHAESAGTASGEISHAEAYGTASGYGSHAEGSSNASASNSHAEGAVTVASGLASHAEGYNSTASETASHAEGRDTTSSGSASHAEGYSTEATASYSHAEGYNTEASGNSSHAEGYQTVASGSKSHAEGDGTIAKNALNHVFGRNNVADPGSSVGSATGRRIEIVGNGTSDTERSNARALDWDGNEYLMGTIILYCNADSTGGKRLVFNQDGTVTWTAVT